MKPCFPAQLAGFMVRAASLLVPRRDRSAWTAEWTAELWHLCHPRGCELGDAPDADPVRVQPRRVSRCLLASLRSRTLRRLARILQSGSAARCALFLAATAIGALLVCLCLPGVRSALLPLLLARRRRSGHDLQQWLCRHAGTLHPPRRLRGVDHRHRHALYADRLLSPHGQIRASAAPCARADSPSRRPATTCFSCSTSPSRTPAHPSQNRENRVSSSPAAHGAGFTDGDPHLVGRTADIDGQPVLIAAVMPDSDWRFAGPHRRGAA